MEVEFNVPVSLKELTEGSGCAWVEAVEDVSAEDERCVFGRIQGAPNRAQCADK
jgi:hypothetical protein